MMRMIQCRDCGSTVSASAKACPFCGAVRPQHGRFRRGVQEVSSSIVAIGFLLLVGSCVMGVLA